MVCQNGGEITRVLTQLICVAHQAVHDISASEEDHLSLFIEHVGLALGSSKNHLHPPKPLTQYHSSVVGLRECDTKEKVCFPRILQERASTRNSGRRGSGPC
jgi:hypothetical protein